MEKVLVFNVDIFKANLLYQIFKPLGIEVCSVAKGQQENTIADLLSGKNKKNDCKKPFMEDLIVFCNIPDNKLDFVLEQLRKSCPISYKAIATKYNLKWSAVALMEELKKEREKLNRG